MPQRPVRTVNVVIQPMSPSQVTLKMAKDTMRTITLCPKITKNCVISCPKRISVLVRPINKLDQSELIICQFQTNSIQFQLIQFQFQLLLQDIY